MDTALRLEMVCMVVIVMKVGKALVVLSNVHTEQHVEVAQMIKYGTLVIQQVILQLVVLQRV